MHVILYQHSPPMKACSRREVLVQRNDSGQPKGQPFWAVRKGGKGRRGWGLK